MQSMLEMPKSISLATGVVWLCAACGGQQTPPVDTARTLPTPEPQADLTRAPKAPSAPAASSDAPPSRP